MWPEWTSALPVPEKRAPVPESFRHRCLVGPSGGTGPSGVLSARDARGCSRRPLSRCPTPPVPVQAEVSRAEVELALNRLKAEEGSLHDSLSKMSALNEGLAQDKAELNQIIIQVRPLKATRGRSSPAGFQVVASRGTGSGPLLGGTGTGATLVP